MFGNCLYIRMPVILGIYDLCCKYIFSGIWLNLNIKV